MITAPPAVRVPPTTPPPGPLETAVGLLLAQVAPLRQDLWAMLSAYLLGVRGARPMPAGVAAEAAGYTRSWLRDLLGQVRALALITGPPGCVVEGVRVLQDGPVRTVEQARAALVTAGVSVTGVHPGALLRVAEVVGVPCRARLVDDLGGQPVLVPAGPAALGRQVRAAATSACRLVALAPLEVVAATAGVPTTVAGSVLAADRRWVIHEDATTGRWCWRRPTPGARPALVPATAVRLLAVRDYTPDQLREAVVDAVRRLPPSTRQDLDPGDLPPARLLVAWLATTGLLRPAGPDGRLRCEASAGLRSDLVLAAAVTAAGTPLSTADQQRATSRWQRY